MNSPLILSYNDYSRANAEKKEKVKYGGSNLKVYIFLADGFEEIEGLTVVDIMRRAKIDVETISITGQKQINGAHKIIVEAERLFEETDFSGIRSAVSCVGCFGWGYARSSGAYAG